MIKGDKVAGDPDALWLRSKWPRQVWLLVNCIAMVIHFILSKPLWLYHLEPGSMSWGGPGDGLYFFIMLLLPWLAFVLINLVILVGKVGMALFGNDGLRWMLVSVQVLILLGWLAVGVIEQRLSQVPEGVTRMGS